MAALRLGMTLLENGNTEAQNKLLNFLKRTQNTEFFYRLSMNIKGGVFQLKEWMKVVRLQKEMATRRTKRGSIATIPNPAIAGLNSTAISLRFLQMACEG